MSKSNKTKG